MQEKSVVKSIIYSSLHLPIFLEPPNELDGYAEEIKILKENRK